VVVRLNKAIVDAVKSPDVAQRLIGFGLNPTGTSPDELGRIQKAHAALWEPVIKASGFTAD
jgi:tripartite-type tricarboxylate transporter receptor subunit TctC